MIVILPLGAVMIGILLAVFLRSMMPGSWGQVGAFLLGSLLSAAMPFGLSIAAAEEAGPGDAALLPLLGIAAAFVGLIAFIATMVVMGTDDADKKTQPDRQPGKRRSRR